MKTTWTKKVPKENGWYWVKYNSKNGKAICPAVLYSYPDEDTFTCSTGYGDILNHNGQIGHSHKPNLKFGNKIEEPDGYNVLEEQDE